jgi:hypothetical protein
MIYIVSTIIFILILSSLSNIFVFSTKFSKNRKRIRLLEKKLLWNIPSWLTLVYAALPGIGEKIIKKQKDTIMERQLLFLLGELSSNLIGGVSTSETITESLINVESPLKNKLSLYLMLSKKQGSIKTLEQMIAKEQNVFMRMFFVMLLNHIKNGGAISESIRKLQKILFLRTNIKQRINAQLLQTKIQIIAGTILPYFMFGVMSLLYGDMIRAVFSSKIGITMLCSASILHIIGVMLFIRICRFNMNIELNGSMLFEYMSFSLKNGIGVITSLKDSIDAGLIDQKTANVLNKLNSTVETISALSEIKESYMKNLSSILKKGHSLGIGISEELSLQAQDILEKLEQRATRFQQAAPAKALVPMLFCIFPATYLMILAPVLVQVLN